MIEKTCLLYKKQKCTLGKEGGGLSWVQKDKREVIFILDLLHWSALDWGVLLEPCTTTWYKTVLGITITSKRFERRHFPGRQSAIKIIHRDTIGQSVAKGQ